VASHLTRALRNRNYRLFFSGQTVSLVGTWITRIATSWLVYRLTHSVFLLGVVGFFGQVPTLVLAPFAGVLVDRWNRHRILVVTQVLSMLQSAALAVLTFAGIITVADILVLQVVQGVINAFDTPARQAFVVEMVSDRADLPNAIALNSSMANASRIIGPSIGGVLIAIAGEGWCFAVDAISYLAVIASLVAMRLEDAVDDVQVLHVGAALVVDDDVARRRPIAERVGEPVIRDDMNGVHLLDLMDAVEEVVDHRTAAHRQEWFRGRLR